LELIVLFPRFRFEHPITGRQIAICGLSYLWAGLSGPIYVLWIERGGRGALWALAVSIGYVIGLIAIVGISTYMSSVDELLMLVVLVPTVVLAHGRAMIFLIRADFRRRGWMMSIE
jgi:hypothetical protein